ncbi:helix-turn-helix domain-containing protein [Streptomyces zingiberis]|uniref:DUF4115 domain-containing protein n=1 Tax=Streptomyces zingiberis TaxID=2053010 RepID=A0ABX1BZU0_9ACTN|nr:helix-turn-helix domain-containing protein [Streptomyces zingiberis]NJQ01918.1 DUF4115 domain-containing protein [Streptomyces zingiberis]
MSLGNSPADDRPSVGRALQQARLDAGLTVDQVSAVTRVRVPIIQAIEQDDYEPCGGDVYARGHIRAVARAVGVDAAALVDQFDAEHGGRPQPTPAAPLFEAERIRPEPSRPNWTAAMVAAIVAVIGFVGFTLVSDGDEGKGAPAAGDSATSSPSPQPSDTKPADPKPEPSDSAIAAAPADKVTVKLTAEDGSSWILAKDHNGTVLHQGVLQEGDSRTFTDEEQIDLILGNAGAVQLYVNGKEVKDDYKPGEVQRLTYTKGDPQAG